MLYKQLLYNIITTNPPKCEVIMKVKDCTRFSQVESD